MEVFSSTETGIAYDAILDGFGTQRQMNEKLRIAAPIEHGSETRVLMNRARFAAIKAQREVPTSSRIGFVDHKIWTA